MDAWSDGSVSGHMRFVSVPVSPSTGTEVSLNGVCFVVPRLVVSALILSVLIQLVQGLAHCSKRAQYGRPAHT